MPVAIPFQRDLQFSYGEAAQVSPLIRRVVARNPGPFTFHGTGTYIVGRGQVAVVDPGPLIDEHVAALKTALAGETVTHILVTHTHSDHSPAARALKEWTGAKTYAFGAHAEPRGINVGAEEGGDFDFVPDIRVANGERIVGAGYTLECVHTPGHTSNHMCYGLAEERALFTGDHVMGWSTSVVIPPDGDMAEYLASLRKLTPREDRIYWPTHGGPIANPVPYVETLIAHRVEREEQVLAQIARGVHRVGDMVAAMYAGVDKRLHPAAAMSVLAHLIKLVREGRVITDGEATLSAEYRLAQDFPAPARP